MSSVLLAVGHGMQPSGIQDPGAVKGSWSEQRAMDITVSTAAASLRKDGRVKVYDEAYKKDPNFSGTVRDANRLGVSILVSCHQDWAEGLNDVYGFWYPGSKKGEKLTKTILKVCWDGGLPRNDAWTKARSLYLLKYSDMPATLLEFGRVGATDWTKVGKLEYVGILLAKGILDYFGLEGEAPNPVDKEIPEKEVPTEVSIPKFPLPRGHWYGEPSRNPRNHSGYHWVSDRSGIRTFQRKLRNRGWSLTVDGFFGPRTEHVVRAFQKEKGLTVDSLVGPITWKAFWTEPIT